MITNGAIYETCQESNLNFWTKAVQCDTITPQEFVFTFLVIAPTQEQTSTTLQQRSHNTHKESHILFRQIFCRAVFDCADRHIRLNAKQNIPTKIGVTARKTSCKNDFMMTSINPVNQQSSITEWIIYVGEARKFFSIETITATISLNRFSLLKVMFIASVIQVKSSSFKCVISQPSIQCR